MSGPRAGRAWAVIGANWGDEGKGMAVAHAAAALGPQALCVRFNGGAQAGHTVGWDGRRHVFSHVGAGAAFGLATYLSRHFVFLPPALLTELAELERLGVRPRIFVDPEAAVTTPFDVLVNRALEVARGAGRHGSVGLGFGETVGRGSDPGVRLTVGDLADCGRAAARLRAIAEGWLPARLSALGLGHALPAPAERARAIEAMLDTVPAFLARIERVGPGLLREGRPLLFEGAQGLALDEVRGAFPHVTRSRTGLINAAALAQAAGCAALEVTYVTRAYATRHGAGPLPHELAGPPTDAVRDPTNRPGPWQGNLRFGRLDLDALAARIAADLADAPAGLGVTAGLAVSCLDQVAAGGVWVREGRDHRGGPDRLLGDLAAATGLEPRLRGFGPDVADWTEAVPGRLRAA